MKFYNTNTKFYDENGKLKNANENYTMLLEYYRIQTEVVEYKLKTI